MPSSDIIIERAGLIGEAVHSPNYGARYRLAEAGILGSGYVIECDPLARTKSNGQVSELYDSEVDPSVGWYIVEDMGEENCPFIHWVEQTFDCQVDERYCHCHGDGCDGPLNCICEAGDETGDYGRSAG